MVGHSAETATTTTNVRLVCEFCAKEWKLKFGLVRFALSEEFPPARTKTEE